MNKRFNIQDTGRLHTQIRHNKFTCIWTTLTVVLPLCSSLQGRNIRSVVPKNFPYFHVEWAPDGGYAH
eukprot:39396-Eustigmatos_ZCMA.PRE.1